MKTIETRTVGQVLIASAVNSGLLFSPAGDQGFFLIVLLGPIATGVVAAARGYDWRPVAAAWALAGVVMLAYDWIANNEDQAFHVALALMMSALAWGGAMIARVQRG